MMKSCWEIVPNDRPSFKALHMNTSKYTERIAGYVDMNYNPFAGRNVKKEKRGDTNEYGFESVSLKVVPPSVEMAEVHSLY